MSFVVAKYVQTLSDHLFNCLTSAACVKLIRLGYSYPEFASSQNKALHKKKKKKKKWYLCNPNKGKVKLHENAERRHDKMM